LGFTTVVVRHYFRGGAVASLLVDRYLRFGTPRPIAETLASEQLRSLGIQTPRVVAAAVYPGGPFYRGDIATEFIGGGVDLGEILFGGAEFPTGGREPRGEASPRVSALTETVALIKRLAAAGIYHPDLNVKNFLVEAGPSSMKVHLLDLDRCRIASDGESGLRDAMIRRLRSSLAKWERMTGQRLAREEWETTGYMSIS
jgi:3-deoxy-D-manno-octulosonic acid kinase